MWSIGSAQLPPGSIDPASRGVFFFLLFLFLPLFRFRVSMGLDGFRWVSMGFDGFRWVSMGFGWTRFSGSVRPDLGSLVTKSVFGGRSLVDKLWKQLGRSDFGKYFGRRLVQESWGHESFRLQLRFPKFQLRWNRFPCLGDEMEAPCGFFSDSLLHFDPCLAT